jgi:peptidoglycan-associated lipoprotein
MRLRHAAILALALMPLAACRKKPPVDNPGPDAGQDAAAERERIRQDSIRMADQARADRERAERERAQREAAERERRTAGARAALTEMVFFEFDSDELTVAAQDVLQRKVLVLRANPGVQVRIEGHADERGSTEYNLALGQRRAESVRAYLAGFGIDADRFGTVSFGKERPLTEGTGEDSWSRNRRAEFTITGGEVSVVPQELQ